jgi:hypothetical protein
VRPNTRVDAVTERQMAVVPPRGIELVRAWEDPLVKVRRVERGYDRIAGTDSHAVDLGVASRQPERSEPASRRLGLPQKLLDHRRHELRLLMHRPQDSRLSEQRDDAVDDLRGYRLASGAEQITQERNEFAISQPIVPVAGSEEVGHSIITRLVPLALD